MKINMSIGEEFCDVKVLSNELTCRIPKGVVIPSEGLPVKVRQSTELHYLIKLILHIMLLSFPL